MIQTTLKGREVLIVDAPKNAKQIGVGYFNGKSALTWKYCGEWHDEDSIPGTWSIVGPGLCSEVTEEEARGLVERDWWYDGQSEDHGLGKVTWYREYPKELEDSTLLSAIESLHSFIRSNGKEPSKCVLLINQNSKS